MLKFDVTEQMIQVIGRALGQMPHDIARPVIDELQRQINAQQQNAVPKQAEPTVTVNGQSISDTHGTAAPSQG